MGMFKKHSGWDDPTNFEILRTRSIGSWCVLEVQYPNATNYEGRKIMVYRRTLVKILQGIMDQKRLDPHFAEHSVSPFARFEPTAAGWTAAVTLAHDLAAP